MNNCRRRTLVAVALGAGDDPIRIGLMGGNVIGVGLW